jgi:hypothetical protein
MRARSRRWAGVAVWVGLGLAPMSGHAQQAPQAEPAARDAAMRQLQRPGGVGGCVFAALPADVRREALVRALAGQGGVSEVLREPVSRVSERCSGRPYSATDAPLVGSVANTFTKAAAALGLAQQFGVGQTALDDAWRGATDIMTGGEEPYVLTLNSRASLATSCGSSKGLAR